MMKVCARPRWVLGLVFLLLTLGAEAEAAERPIAIVVQPSLLVPVGDSWDWFTPGLALQWSAGNPLGDSPWMSRVGLDFAGLPDRAGTPIYFFTYLMGIEGSWPVSPDSSLGLGAAAGASWGAVASFSRFAILPYGEAGLLWTNHLAPTLDFQLGTAYKLWWGTLQAVSATAAFHVWLGGDR